MATPDTSLDAFRALARSIDPAATLRRTWPLAGGVSAEVTVLELERGTGQVERLVVRCHGEADRAANPDIARDEFTLLELVRAHGLPTPRPVLVDDSGSLFPTPVLVVAFVEGETVLAPADPAPSVQQAAATLARIHTIADSPALAFLPRREHGFGPPPARLDASMREGAIRDALTAAWPPSSPNPPTLLHGDYWPGNLLWRDGQLAAVIDWEDAAVGDPLADLGNSRLEFLWAFGPEAMAGLSRDYLARSAIDPGNLAYWDLVAALRPCGKLATWGLDAATEHRMRDQHAWFVDQAMARLAPA